MMGYAQRAREEAERVNVARYRVRRWTAFEWSPPEGADMRPWRKEKSDHLKRAAASVLRSLNRVAPDCAPRVSQVSVGGRPELLFEVEVMACDGDDARRRAMRHIDRALCSKIPVGMGRKVRLAPPWGKAEVELA